MSDVPSDYPEIVPKSSRKARGIDFCGIDDNYYIVRSDLGVYMKCCNFSTGEDIHIYSLSAPCRWGDHYLACDDDSYYIIKGNSYRRVKNLNTDEDAAVYKLHPNCQGGDFYYSSDDRFYIIFLKRGVYRKVKSLHSDEDAVEYSISEDFKDGIYFWASHDHVYCLKQATEWGVNYHRTRLRKKQNPETFSVHESVLNFLPGGLAQTQGKAFGEWQRVKFFKNGYDTSVTWERTVMKTVGFKKTDLSSIEHNWSIGIGASSGLTAAIARFELSLNARYGGKSIQTTTEEWNEATVHTDKITMSVACGSEVSVWQFQLGFGEKKCLFCDDMQITKDRNPPLENPVAVDINPLP